MNKYLYPIYKLNKENYIKWWLYHYLDSKGANYVLSEILTGTSFYLEDSLDRQFNMFEIYGRTTQESTTQSANLFDEAYYNKDSLYTIGTYKYALTRIKGNRTLYVRAVLKDGKTSISGLYVAITTNGSNPNSGTSGFIVSNGQNATRQVDYTGYDDLYFSFYPTNINVNTIFDTYNIMVSTDNVAYVPFVPDSPTPYYPSSIKNTGDNGSVNEKVQNKNFYNEENKTIGKWLSSSGVMSNNPNAIITDYIKILDSRNYVSTSNNTTSSTKYFTINQYDDNKNRITGNEYSVSANAIRINKTFVFEDNCKYIKISLLDYANMPNFQLEEGSTASTYVAHAEQNISFPLAEGQNFMEGDYLADDGIHHKMGDDELSTLTWQSLGSNLYRSTVINNIKVPETTSTVGNIIAEKYRARRQAGSFSNGEIAIMGETYTGCLLACDETGTPTGKCQYELAEEVIEPYTEEQQAVWEEIKALRTYKPVTHISSTDETPAELKIQYWKEET